MAVPEVPYKIEIVTNPGYINVDQYGEVTMDDVEVIRREIFELVAREKLSRVLVDVREQSNDFSITELFNMTVDHAVAQTPFPKPRVCLVVRRDQEDNARFIENVGLNRGLPIKCFIDKEAALAWLQG